MQTTGHKGIGVTLVERGANILGGKLDEKVEILAAHPDFFDEWPAVQHIYHGYGCKAFFGAISHAELAYIECKWERLKCKVRPLVMITGKMKKLNELNGDGLANISVVHNREDARRCRGAMRAYRVLRAGDSKAPPEEIAKKVGEQKRHRCE